MLGFTKCMLAMLMGVALLQGSTWAAPSPKVDLRVERIGVPFPSWSAPVYSHATPFNLHPHLTRHTHLAPRFHRLLRYTMDVNSKSQTAIFVAGRSAADEENGKEGASIMSALNPRNGEPVWRTIRNDSDPMHSMHLLSEVLFTLSGQGQIRASMHHALTGQLLWTTVLPHSDRHEYSGLMDAALLLHTYEVASTASVAAAAPDVIVMDRTGRVIRLAGVNGATVWVSEVPSRGDGAAQETEIPIRLHSTQTHTIVISLISHKPLRKIFSTKESYSLRVRVLSSGSGRVLTSYDIANANVEMTSVSSRDNTVGNVVVLGQAGSEPNSIKPHLVWLQTDGTIRSLPLVLPSEVTETTIESKMVHTIKTQIASRYVYLNEIDTLSSSRAVLMATTDDGKSEALRITEQSRALEVFWAFDEDAKDAVYSGTIDRQGKAYLNRMFFSGGQHLLNFHVLWIDSYEGKGQVTGFSFQWDHDLNGDVLCAPFEASQVSEFQLVTRATFVTSSSSIRMIQEDRHFWMREEGLSHTTAAILVDLPESRLVHQAQSSSRDAKFLLDGEGSLHRFIRHMNALQHFPSWLTTVVWEGLEEIPQMSLDTFGISGLKPAEPADKDDNDKQKPKQTTSSFKKYGAAPIGGVGAQKVKQGKNVPAGVPPVSTRKVASPSQGSNKGPPPPVALAPRYANETTVNNLTRDQFGFRKLIIATSKKGKIYAVDSQSGQHVWEKSLVGYGKGEGTENPKVTVRLLALVRSASGTGTDITTTVHSSDEADSITDAAHLKYGPLLTVVAEVEEAGLNITRMWEIDPLTGKFPGSEESQTGLVLFPGVAKDAFLLPIEDAGSGRIAIAAIDRKDKIYIWPTTSSISQQFASMTSDFYYVLQEHSNDRLILAGYTPSKKSGEVKGERAWQVVIAQNETVTSITRPSIETIASQGKVLGNRSTLYKYLSPHTVVVTTRNEAAKSASVMIVDGITGRLLYEAVLSQGDLSLWNDDGTASKVHVMATENWITIAFDVYVLAADALARYKGAHRQTRLVSIELYENTVGAAKRDQGWSRMSSHVGSPSAPASGSPITVYSQLYVLPTSVRGLSSTRTKYGITSKALLVTNTRGRVMTVPRRLLDPRRPVGRKPTAAEMEEGLGTYDPYIPENPRLYLGAGTQIPLAGPMKTSPSLLESLSIVFVYGSLDWWVTKVAPSGTFDLLNESFNKPQLLLTIAVLTIGLLVSNPMVAGKTLRARW